MQETISISHNWKFKPKNGGLLNRPQPSTAQTTISSQQRHKIEKVNQYS
jgi:nitrite reductase/ring-hydroxylating ferredoxin subunit